jgi:hypothetical protein
MQGSGLHKLGSKKAEDFQARVRSLGASAQVPSSGNILAVIPVGPAGRVPEASYYLNAWEQGENQMEISWGPGRRRSCVVPNVNPPSWPSNACHGHGFS